MKAEAAHGGIHMPDQSWYPLFTALGLGFGMLAFAALDSPFILFGREIFATHLPLALTGLGILFASAYLWALEGPGGYHIHLDAQGNATTVRDDHH